MTTLIYNKEIQQGTKSRPHNGKYFIIKSHCIYIVESNSYNNSILYYILASPLQMSNNLCFSIRVVNHKLFIRGIVSILVT